MTTQIEALKMAIDTFNLMLDDYAFDNCDTDKIDKAINTCKEALQSQEQEPVAWWNGEYASCLFAFNRDTPGIGLKNPKAVPLYTHPKEWQELSDDKISELSFKYVDYDLFDEGEYGMQCSVYVEEFARAIEQALKEKNT